jgi:NDP-sugar pyrophosphorylase family protein
MPVIGTFESETMDGASNRTAVILAGGKGTRLQPYTAEVPKPLVTVGDRPIIEILLRTLKRHGITDIRVAVNHLSHLIMAALGDGRDLGLRISYSREEKELSTVGPLTLMTDLPENFLVVNGDILTDLDYNRLFAHHLEQGTKLTVATCRRENMVDYGVLATGPTGLVTEFREKPSYDFTVSAGVYVFAREVLEFVPKKERFGFDDLMHALLERKEPISTFPYDGYWRDIGRPEDYAQVNNELERVEELLRDR